MFNFIAFVLACLAWQAFKDAVFGRRAGRPVVRLPRSSRASCGCLLKEGRVETPCAAHDMMLKIQ